MGSTDGGGSEYPSRALGHCTVRRLARFLLQGGSPSVFVYMFSHPSQEGIPDMNEGNILTGTGPGSPVVPHASGLPYKFGWHEILHGDGEKALAQAMCKYWSGFAVTGNPNGKGLAHWPHFAESNGELLQFDTELGEGTAAKKHVREGACNFWDRYAWKSEPAVAAPFL